MRKKMTARMRRVRIHPELNDQDWELLGKMFDGRGFYLVRVHEEHLVEVRSLTEGDWHYIIELLSVNDYHLVRTSEKHLVELRRVTLPVPVTPARLSQVLGRKAAAERGNGDEEG